MTARFHLPPTLHCLVIGGANHDIKTRFHDIVQHLDDSNSGVISQHDGGVGRNIAEVLGRLHVKTTLLTALGDDFTSNKMRANLAAFHIDLSHTITVKNMRSDTFISLHDHDGELMMAVNQMPLIKEITPQYIHNKSEVLAQADLIICDCNLSTDTLRKVAELKGDAMLLIDGVSATKVLRAKPILRFCDILKINRTEAITLSETHENSTAEGLISAITDMGVKQVLLSDGGHGFYLNEGDKIHHFEAITATPQTVSGAGDCLFGGFIYGLATQQSLQTSCNIGRQAAFLSCKTVASVNNSITIGNLTTDVIDNDIL